MVDPYDPNFEIHNICQHRTRTKEHFCCTKIAKPKWRRSESFLIYKDFKAQVEEIWVISDLQGLQGPSGDLSHFCSTRISRPTWRRSESFLLYKDFKAHVEEIRVISALQGLQGLSGDLRHFCSTRTSRPMWKRFESYLLYKDFKAQVEIWVISDLQGLHGKNRGGLRHYNVVTTEFDFRRN